MALFPASFIDDLRARADIVRVVQDYVPLKKAGATWKGLCPFHQEKTPSFQVNPDKGFFYCFGCQTGGDVFKFVELQEKVGFQEAVRLLAAKFGMTAPEPAGAGDRDDAIERETLLKVHERAAAWFREQLAGRAGARARQQLVDRGVSRETADHLGLGFAPPAREALKSWLLRQGFELPLLLRSGLVAQREDGQTVDRFRGRLMIPIARDSGSIVAFGGRSMDPDQQPKYLNSPETPIYSKGRTLYGLNLTKADTRRLGYAVLVEGYFDFAQALQAGVLPVVASCGTALTAQQAHLLRRFASKVVLSYDPDAAGQGAAERSSLLLVQEGFLVNVALLPPGDDPDGYIRKQGVGPYVDLIRGSRSYLEYLIDRASQGRDFGSDEARREFLNRMLPVAAQIPDAAARDQFADRLAHRARITEEVVRAEIRRAAVERRPAVTARELPSFGQVRTAERGLLWGLFQDPETGVEALAALEDGDLEGLVTRRILELARGLHDESPHEVPSALLGRLTMEEARLVTGIAAEPAAPAPLAECVATLKRLRYERERAGLQREIDGLQGGDAEGRMAELYRRKMELIRLIEQLST
ncbi:MAG TPA: DNA primase [Vicinamibacterales bacterium]|nr:DNA primase [Vicinamibacterales bacterium]